MQDIGTAAQLGSEYCGLSRGFPPGFPVCPGVSPLWLRRLAEPAVARADEPSPIAAEAVGPRAEPRWLRLEDGMHLALGFACARYLVKAEDRRRFAEGLTDLPSEVILYWFTLCSYGYRQAAGRRPPRQKQLALKEGQELAVREALERDSSSVLGRV